jgi:hypothetical protein
MPDRIKNHACHDTLLVCIYCHDKYEPHAFKLKIDYSKRFNIPIEGGPYVSYPQRKQVQSACKLLTSKYRHGVPKDRIEFLESVVKEFYQVQDLDDEVFRMGKELMIMERADNFKEHGEVIIGSMNDDDIVEFVRIWRRHFLDFIKPQYLSPTWRVDNPVFRT